VDHPERFDAVVTDREGHVAEIQVKKPGAASNWIWGAFKMPASTLRELCSLWHERNCADEYFGSLVNEWIARGNEAWGIRAGTAYVDVGTLHGYREALETLRERSRVEAALKG
jgi:tRNA (mo5U34)-methyltransferase